jgi:hypothetical protein
MRYSGTKEGRLSSAILFSTLLAREKNKNGRHTDKKKEVKLSLSMSDISTQKNKGIYKPNPH